MIIEDDNIVITDSYTPASSTAYGDTGTITWDTNKLYIAVAENTWKSINLSAFGVGYVPYTGASSDVVLSNNSVSITPSSGSSTAGFKLINSGYNNLSLLGTTSSTYYSISGPPAIEIAANKGMMFDNNTLGIYVYGLSMHIENDLNVNRKLYVDHIGEKTGSHSITSDDHIIMASGKYIYSSDSRSSIYFAGTNQDLYFGKPTDAADQTDRYFYFRAPTATSNAYGYIRCTRDGDGNAMYIGASGANVKFYSSRSYFENQGTTYSQMHLFRTAAANTYAGGMVRFIDLAGTHAPTTAGSTPTTVGYLQTITISPGASVTNQSFHGIYSNLIYGTSFTRGAQANGISLLTNSKYMFRVTELGSIILGGGSTGTAADATYDNYDKSITFYGYTNTGVFTWMEDEDYFKYDDDIRLIDGENLIFDTTTGSKIGTATSQKIGFWNVTPVVQQATNAYTSDAESSAYTGIDNAQAGTPYAQLTDLNTLRVAYDNLRASYDDLLTKLKNTGIVA